MDWQQYIPQILAMVAIGLTIARPWLIAHGVPEAIIDQLIVLFGQGTVAATRATLPVDNRGLTYGASVASAASLVGGLAGILPPNVALTMAGTAMGVSALGFQRAVRRLDAQRAL